ncbi:putative aldouronate transport system substrate-binding protein [Paenibacillus sp. UNCCL117]|uniref:extracellular solute-binding protein n=1 Tax=unclassified Paenibacillus TaxID=185978 RepID=UPI00088D9425|nr:MULTISPECIES: extracellular solute-binding protein [unclassified Paenibacillus]SDE25471.1 putative aldouronate transport system substrate-binding protein [Paenibacillus sp. cl123]SFW62424.1 putative aldouronate transport system substrate-binding protein [Paenibacillus sp. UNCCL117]
MRMRKAWVNSITAGVLAGTMLVGCSSQQPAGQTGGTAAPAPAPADEKKPVLKVLMSYQTFDPNKDPAVQRIKEKTGYEVEYHLLPKDNADQKLMLEMASGGDYDIVRLSIQQYSQLAGNGSLLALDELLAKDGGHIQKAISDMGWKSVTTNGKKYGIPFEGGGDIDNPYGLMQGGIGVRSDVLSELGLQVPKTLDSFYDFLKKIKEAKNIAPLTGRAEDGFNFVIGSAFGIGTANWYERNGQLVPRVKLPEYKEYIEFINKLYKEGLIDKDFPVNKSENAKQKFTSGKAASIIPSYFYDIPDLLPALRQSNAKAEMEFITPLAGKNGMPFITQRKEAQLYEAIPKTAKNPQHAMKFMNLRAEPEIFVSTYLGDKGVHYEIKDGKYFPILPAFDELKNSKQFTGAVSAGTEFQMWQARARKTVEMAASYEKMNSVIKKEWFHPDYTNYSTSLPEVQKYRLALDKMEKDFLVKVLVEEKDLNKLYSDFVSEWEKQGGAGLTKAINEWYAENKSAMKF